ncbi:Hypothetical protein D9617_19g101620 [Elsinoe fawcettii]|nr:Hypothetical protein D9617_19g101620 [Elsinoe fawcettii]
MPPSVTPACNACRARKIKVTPSTQREILRHLGLQPSSVTKRGPKARPSIGNASSPQRRLASATPALVSAGVAPTGDIRVSNGSGKPNDNNIPAGRDVDQHRSPEQVAHWRPVQGDVLSPEVRPTTHTRTPQSEDFAATGIDIGLNATVYHGQPKERNLRLVGDDVVQQAFAVQQQLLHVYHLKYPDTSIVSSARECLHYYQAFLFPTVPLIDAEIMRNSTSILENLDALITTRTPSDGSGYEHLQGRLRVIDLVAFSFVTSLWAEVYHMLPADYAPPMRGIEHEFLFASRQMLLLQQDSDLESPSSMSIIIRYFHCNCLHSVGKARLSWLLLGEAIRLVQEMDVRNEASLAHLGEYEACARRRVFWQLYTGDKSAALLNNRPFTLDTFSLELAPTLKPPETDLKRLLIRLVPAEDAWILQRNLIVGFNLCQTIFGLASELLLELRVASKFYTYSGVLALADIPPQQKRRMTDLYFQFTLALDRAPIVLKEFKSVPAVPIEKDNVGLMMYQIQAVNLAVTHTCLHLILVQQFASGGAHSVLGLSDERHLLDLKRTEIAREMVRVTAQADFAALRLNGESCVEKIRQAGAALLEISQNQDNPHIAGRAQQDFAALLDILARLDSRACEGFFAERTTVL